jgi:hypothetical protein
MISFMISVVPPKLDWMQLSRQSPALVPERLGPVLPPAKAGLHLVVDVMRADPVRHASPPGNVADQSLSLKLQPPAGAPIEDGEIDPVGFAL